MWYLGREARLLTFDGRMLLGSFVRSSGEFGTKVRVSVLAGSQDFLPDVGNTQSDYLRVIAGVRTVREGPRFTYCLNAASRDATSLFTPLSSRPGITSPYSPRWSWSAMARVLTARHP